MDDANRGEPLNTALTLAVNSSSNRCMQTLCTLLPLRKASRDLHQRKPHSTAGAASAQKPSAQTGSDTAGSSDDILGLRGMLGRLLAAWWGGPWGRPWETVRWESCRRVPHMLGGRGKSGKHSRWRQPSHAHGGSSRASRGEEVRGAVWASSWEVIPGFEWRGWSHHWWAKPWSHSHIWVWGWPQLSGQ